MTVRRISGVASVVQDSISPFEDEESEVMLMSWGYRLSQMFILRSR